MCRRHYYRARQHGDPTKFLVAQKYDKFDGEGNAWCQFHQAYMPTDHFTSLGKCRIQRRLSRYGLTAQEFAELQEGAPDGVCPLCLTRPIAVIDHDHETGKVRGMLCKHCNAAIGVLTEVGVQRACDYLHGGRSL